MKSRLILLLLLLLFQIISSAYKGSLLINKPLDIGGNVFGDEYKLCLNVVVS